MSIIVAGANGIKSSNLDILTDVVYENFIYLKDVPNLSHSRRAIYEVLTSSKPQIYLVLVNGAIASYLIGEIVKLKDGRGVLYITYLFTADQFRSHGYASKLMAVADDISKRNSLDGLMLTCDSENIKTYDFYMKKGFMPDMLLRTYQKYEVLFKN